MDLKHKLRMKILVNKNTKQLSIALSKKKLKEHLKGKIPKFIEMEKIKLEF